MSPFLRWGTSRDPKRKHVRENQETRRLRSTELEEST